MPYQVRIIHFGEQGFPGPALYFMRRFGETLKIPFYLWLIQGEGRTILVDAGASAKQAEEANPGLAQVFGEACAWRIKPEEEPVARLAELGLSPDDVQTIILTHCHPDHALGIKSFPKAELVMSQSAWAALDSPAHPALVSPAVFPPEVLNLLRSELNGRFRLVGDGEEFVPGIRCYRLGGHSPDLTAVTVETSAGEVVIASDGAIFYDSLELGVPSAGYNFVESLNALEWIKQRGGIVLPGHDWKVLERHPDGVIG
jgi:glyoxylase-like metal-dependent hydrolase (beta-lactamase superfamily II)